ncbi:hypothetical protein ACFV0B_11155 [Streptomyces xanthophaeus]|uniref:hypothetical protein n=1 Tax=Streptomyces xanthophaeus TaxID=67385 RepID=UPI0036BC9295
MKLRQLTREERTERLRLLRGRESARRVRLSGGNLLELPIKRRISAAIFDPGLITPRGDDYTEPLCAWQARAVLYVLAEDGGQS